MPKSFEKQFLHFARYLNLEIGISVQECQGVGEVVSSLFLSFHFDLRLVPGSSEFPITNPNCVMVDRILPLLW